jgi:spore coat polysaccharide biosynthesis protein SpsF (cytidylyltransferase family)
MAIEVNRHQPIYAANCNVERILKGFDVEFIKSSSLTFINYQNLNSYQLEHVTPFFYSGYFSESLIRNFFFPQHAQNRDLNFSVDTAFDLKFIREINNVFDLFNKDFYQINALVRDMSEIKRILHMN